MEMNFEEFVGLALISALIIVIIIASMITYGQKQEIKELKAIVVEKGVAEWVTDPESKEPVFKWVE